MGEIFSNMWAPDLEPVLSPWQPKFDPMIGFPNGRKVREVKTTLEEMESAAIPPELRDFCIDYYMKFLSCRADHYPLIYKCKHEVHAHHDCQYEDHVLRMKELEREKRLMKVLGEKDKELLEE